VGRIPLGKPPECLITAYCGWNEACEMPPAKSLYPEALSLAASEFALLNKLLLIPAYCAPNCPTCCADCCPNPAGPARKLYFIVRLLLKRL
jgi:hypothetical protein